MRGRRRIRPSSFGRRENLSSRFLNASATNQLIWINIIFFVLVVLLMFIFGLKIFDYISLKPNFVMKGGYVWTFLTSMFMHAPGPMMNDMPTLLSFFSFHLLINMFVLFSLGNLCEKIIGRKRYLWFYIISGIIAGLAFVLLAYFFGDTALGGRIFGSPEIAAVGASGAIFAIAGLFMVLTPRLKFMIIFLPFFALPAYVMIPLVLFGTWLVSSSVGIGIGNTAHFGGFLVGIIFGFYLRKKYRRKTQAISRYFAG
jgi:membrane associated rhomboid family serine protease